MAELKANEIYVSALAIMNEQDADNSYKDRSVPIINALMSQCYQYTEEYESGLRSGWTPITELNDEVVGFDKTMVLGVMPYGLAAALFLDEDGARANSWQQQYEEGLLNARRVPHEMTQITDIYDCVGSESYGAW